MSLPIAKLAFLENIRGFVAVGRRMSITQAAEDLCLTQSAVSRQIIKLEEQLGVSLLTRGHRSITLTKEGERLFRGADVAIQQLQDVLGEVKATGAARPVTLGSSVGVVGLWLLPKLNEFQRMYPEIDLRLSANNNVVEPRHEDLDLVIRYTTSENAPNGSVRLFDENVSPVAHPSLGITLEQLIQPPLNFPLIEIDYPVKHLHLLRWQDWLGDEGWSASQAFGVIHLNLYSQVIQAALASQGVALGRISLIQPLIDEGKLVMISTADEWIRKSGYAYWLIQADESPRPEVLRVSAWLQNEAKKTLNWRPKQS